MAKKTVEELKAFYDQELDRIRKAKNEAVKKAQAKAEKAAAAERTKLRKQDAHMKLILGGYVMAAIKKNKDKAYLEKFIATLKNEKDKKLFQALLGSLD